MIYSHDDELKNFAEKGALPLPEPTKSGRVFNEGANIWYALFASEGQPPDNSLSKNVVLLHGGLGHSGNWGYQLPTLRSSGYNVITIDSRGHGRSTRDSRPYKYELMASDAVAVLDSLAVERVSVVGWSDGACTSMILGMKAPERVAGVFFFGCNMDPSGTDMKESPLLSRCFGRHVKDYETLSDTPDGFDDFRSAVEKMMKTEPNYTAQQLGEISREIKIAIVQSENDEFIKPEHARYLSETIPSAELIILPDVSHFAPLQRPDEFNKVLLNFLVN